MKKVLTCPQITHFEKLLFDDDIVGDAPFWQENLNFLGFQHFFHCFRA